MTRSEASSPQETRSEVTPKVLAERLGVTTRTLLNLVKEGLPKTGNGATARHPWPAAREWFNEYLRGQAEKTQTDLDYEQARVRKISAAAAREEYLLALAERRMVTVEDAAGMLEDVLQRLRGKLLSFAPKLAPRLVGLTSHAAVLALLNLEVEEIMAELQSDRTEAKVA